MQLWKASTTTIVNQQERNLMQNKNPQLKEKHKPKSKIQIQRKTT